MPGKGSPEFVALLQKCIEVHYKKNHDYANDANPFSNFDRQGIIVSWFSKPIDQAFTSVIAIKIARLAELLSNDTEPNNESIDDNFVDLVNYCGLWAAWHVKNNTKSSLHKEQDPINQLNSAIQETLSNPEKTSNIVCNFCGRHFTDIMAIRTKNGNFCGNKCADNFESAKASSKGVRGIS